MHVDHHHDDSIDQKYGKADLVCREISLLVSLVVTIQGPHDGGPGLLHGQNALHAALQLLTLHTGITHGNCTRQLPKTWQMYPKLLQLLLIKLDWQVTRS